jgi:hypothetical protein
VQHSVAILEAASRHIPPRQGHCMSQWEVVKQTSCVCHCLWHKLSRNILPQHYVRHFAHSPLTSLLVEHMSLQPGHVAWLPKASFALRSNKPIHSWQSAKSNTMCDHSPLHSTACLDAGPAVIDPVGHCMHPVAAVTYGWYVPAAQGLMMAVVPFLVT